METIVKRPDLYDLLYKGFDEDVPMYIEMTKEMPYVIEYGAGTGRITIPLAEAGKDVIAVDNENKMLGKLKEKLDKLSSEVRERITFVQDDMVTYIHKDAPCIMIPFSTFNYLLSKEEQERCISSISTSLKPGGQLIMELITMETFPEVLKTNETIFIKKIEMDESNYCEYWRNTTYNEQTKIMIQNRIFKFFNENNTLINEINIYWENRFIRIDEITNMLNKYGIEITNLYGDCSFGGYTDESEFVVIEALKK